LFCFALQVATAIEEQKKPLFPYFSLFEFFLSFFYHNKRRRYFCVIIEEK
jgi:hypothetical protein